MDKPKTRFTKAGGVALAYQVVGDGPIDLVYATGWLHNIEIVWEHPRYRKFLEGLASIARLILFDKRGMGLSDRDTGAPTLEERAEDIRAVMDAAGSRRATVLGQSEGGLMTVMFAACYPERVRSIVLLDCRPCVAWKPDWPSGVRRAEFEEMLREMLENWGEPVHLGDMAPSIAPDPQEQAWYARFLTLSGSPSSVAAYARVWYGLDVRAVLPSVACPALVIHRRGDRTLPSEQPRFMAERIPNGRFVQIEGQDHLPWAGNQDRCLELITEFVDVDAAPPREDRLLLSVLMSDIVDSTVLAAQLGDAAWRQRLAAHDSMAAQSIGRHAGQYVKSTGDGVLATFSGPSRAISCARELHAGAEKIGLGLRAGIHMGECLRHGQDDVTGLGIVIAARIMDQADRGETLVSSTVCDLVVGSGLEFDQMGSRALKGVPGEWRLARVSA